VLGGPFTPMLFMGEEWGAATPWQFFTDFGEPELARAVRSGRQEEFAEHGWTADEVPDPQSSSTRGGSVLDWAEPEEAGHARLLDWYRSLIRLRRVTPDLRADDLRAVHASYDEAARWFVLARGSHRVVLNLSEQPQDVPLSSGDPMTVLLAWAGCELSATSVRLAGQSAAVLGPA
jgi:maltooligosyltrehalose trehalohydrolase